MDKEELLSELGATANFMRGMQFDTRLPSDVREALRDRAIAIDELVEKYIE